MLPMAYNNKYEKADRHIAFCGSDGIAFFLLVIEHRCLYGAAVPHHATQH